MPSQTARAETVGGERTIRLPPKLQTTKKHTNLAVPNTKKHYKPKLSKFQNSQNIQALKLSNLQNLWRPLNL